MLGRTRRLRPGPPTLQGAIWMIDQRQLPGELVLFQATNVAETVKAIKDMAVRGAPAIGAAGAFGLALAAFASSATTAAELLAHLEDVKRTLDASRPTAGTRRLRAGSKGATMANDLLPAPPPQSTSCGRRSA